MCGLLLIEGTIREIHRTMKPLRSICVTNDHGYVPLVVITTRSLPHSWLITGFVTKVTQRVPHVEQELPTPPEHLSSRPFFSGNSVARSLVFYVMFLQIVVCPFVLFILAIVLPVLPVDLRILITPLVRLQTFVLLGINVFFVRVSLA